MKTYCSCFEGEERYSFRFPVQIFTASVGKKSHFPLCNLQATSSLHSALLIIQPTVAHFGCLVWEWVYCMMSLFLSDKCGNSLLLCTFTTKPCAYLTTCPLITQVENWYQHQWAPDILFFLLAFYNVLTLVLSPNYPSFVTMNIKLVSTHNRSPDNEKTKWWMQIRNN